MNFEKLLLANFRTSHRYGTYLFKYYEPLLITLCVNVDSRSSNEYNERFTGDRRAEHFRIEKIVATVIESPLAKTYPSITKLMLQGISRQVRELYSEPEKRKLAEEVIEAFRSIYENIEKLTEEERMVMKILFTVDHRELVRKHLQFANITGLKETAMKQLREALPEEQFLNLEAWMKMVSEIS